MAKRENLSEAGIVWAEVSKSFEGARHLFAAIAETDDFDRMFALALIGQELMAAAELRADEAMMSGPEVANG
ncbi:hypothetical protein KDW98_09110 [Burkholderia vietnamiensis]|uniref:hypothetical protein n=1 Tax=Burkholderia vietnamiensis TaxID=60552 RepID=UPI001B9C854E|nr:hypothetical protein [Burkholderia vietnamiensis]MBR8161330.1 hypothetical protein [Burkholderia vietnamiensis]MCA8147882.1 hypothetical protein [Burkholderia vietnamiensis]